MSERRISVRSIIFKDGKILAQKPKDPRSKEPIDFWCTMGGGMDPGESIKECLRREMIEETGIEPEIGRLLYIQQFMSGRHRNREIMDFFFEVKNVDDYETIDLTKTTHGEIETDDYGFVDPNSVNLMPKFLCERDIARDIREHTEVIIFNNIDEK